MNGSDVEETVPKADNWKSTSRNSVADNYAGIVASASMSSLLVFSEFLNWRSL